MKANEKVSQYFYNIFTMLAEKADLNVLIGGEDFTYDEYRDWYISIFGKDNFYWNKKPLYINGIDGIKFSFSTGETKLVIIIDDYRESNNFGEKFVIKIPFSDKRYDYCLKEEEITEYILDNDYYNPLKKMFALCYSAFTFFGRKIYLMERVTTDEDNCKGISKLISKDKERFRKRGYSEQEIEDYINSRSNYYYSSGSEVTMDIIRAYCLEEELDILSDFICIYNINDVHRGNIGFIEDNPVIIDYSGYYENEYDSSTYNSSEDSDASIVFLPLIKFKESHNE